MHTVLGGKVRNGSGSDGVIITALAEEERSRSQSRNPLELEPLTCTATINHSPCNVHVMAIAALIKVCNLWYNGIGGTLKRTDANILSLTSCPCPPPPPLPQLSCTHTHTHARD